MKAKGVPKNRCSTHGDYNAAIAVGCPACMREARDDLKTLRETVARMAKDAAIVRAENRRLRDQLSAMRALNPMFEGIST